MREYLSQILVQNKILSIQEILYNLIAATVIGFIIYFSYYITHTGTIYSKKFNVSLVMLSILTATVMAVIGNNVALSLGMVGALSIVRYRTAIKDSRDTAYIFWAIVTGISCGAGDYTIALLGSVAVFIVLLFLGRIRNDTRKLLVVRGSRSVERKIEGIIFNCFSSDITLRVKNTSKDSVEYIYELTSKQLNEVKRKGISITDKLYATGSIEYVNLVTQNDDITG